MNLFPIYISLISLIITGITLYLTQLRPAKISLLIGPEIQIYHADYPNFSTGMFVPMTFVNSSSSMGTIYKCAITVFRNDLPEQRYFIQWSEFAKIAPDGNWTYDIHSHAFGISGKSDIIKTALFMWNPKSIPKLLFQQGCYTLLVHAWTGKKANHLNFEFSFYISHEEENIFESRRMKEVKTVTLIRLNKDFGENRVLTQHEANSLLT